MSTLHTIELPAGVYERLKALAAEERLDASTMIDLLLKQAEGRLTWQRNWASFVESVQRDGHRLQGLTDDEFAERMRHTREEIWDAEYAHLYR